MRVKYGTGEKIEFPDFTIEYLGERRKTLPVYPRGFLITISSCVRPMLRKSSRGTAARVISGQSSSKSVRNIISSDCAIRIKLGKLKNNEVLIWQANPPS